MGNSAAPLAEKNALECYPASSRSICFGALGMSDFAGTYNSDDP
ncbi:hypothetical protein M2262_000481 [Pseudomonas sp. BIGb0408]|uniref:Uncharacterized protein n=1 Tax=Phytopseudomonas flavescens TaxID=29435 RepID=A0A7Y9XP72_9GAMM|nr:hypothetical protein [Pseudomonas sp. BIGb0408]NYH74996.1 hypothetical protein [Pseudomonas flavescens]